MGARLRNSLFGGFAVVAFIIGTPILQHLFAAVPSMAGGSARTDRTQDTLGEQEGTFQTFRIGDRHFRVVPTGNESATVEMLDSDSKFVAANQNEAILTFRLPNGDEETLRISVPPKSECSMPGHLSGEGDCCDAETMTHDEDCPHEET